MWDSPETMQRDTLETIQRALRVAYFSIAKRLQKKHTENLQSLLDRLEAYNKGAQERKDETGANLAFILSRYVEGVCEFLSMWILLKARKLEKAWDALVTAQENIRHGIRLGELAGFASFNDRLDAAEKLLFPPQKFVSAAPQFAWCECSICGARYGECDHLALNLYMGQMCVAIVRNITGADHVAIVDKPDDKRLRFPNHLSSLTGEAMPSDESSGGHGKKKAKSKRRR
jgi:hypothetical protein